VSGMSVYAPDGPAAPDEEAPGRRFGERRTDPLQARSEAKLGGEAAVRDGFRDGPVLVVRPGIMVGPRDPSDRFTCWPVRMAAALRAGRPSLVALGDPGRAVQYTDARDLASWMLRMLRDRGGGLFNAVGHGRVEPLGGVLSACLQAAREAAGPAAGARELELVWISEDDLAAALAEVEEEARPLWCPEPQISQASIDSSRAVAAGLRFRPALQTARETLAWWSSEGAQRSLRAGLPPAVEARLLAAV
jgi:2'-hydroxyisoflavone reductase